MENQESNNKNSIIQYLLIAFLVITLALGGYLMYENKHLKTDLSDYKSAYELSQIEKGDVIEDLKDMSGEYDSLMTNNDSINSELLAQKDRVDQLLADSKKYNWSIYKLEKEAATLREIMKGFVRTIDSFKY